MGLRVNIIIIILIVFWRILAIALPFNYHQNSGMNLVMQEGEIQDMPPTPPNFPMCNNFRFNSNHFFTSLRNHEKRLASKGEYKILSWHVFFYNMHIIWVYSIKCYKKLRVFWNWISFVFSYLIWLYPSSNIQILTF